VGGHGLSVFERAAIVEIGGDPRCAKGVIADRRGNAGGPRTTLQHAPGVGLRHRAIGQNAGAPDRRAEQGTFAVTGLGHIDLLLDPSGIVRVQTIR